MIKIFIKDWKIIKTINWPYIGQEFEPEADDIIEKEDIEIHERLKYDAGVVSKKPVTEEEREAALAEFRPKE